MYEQNRCFERREDRRASAFSCEPRNTRLYMGRSRLSARSWSWGKRARAAAGAAAGSSSITSGRWRCGGVAAALVVPHDACPMFRPDPRGRRRAGVARDSRGRTCRTILQPPSCRTWHLTRDQCCARNRPGRLGEVILNTQFSAVSSTSTFTSEEIKLRPVSGVQASGVESDPVHLVREQTVPDTEVVEHPVFRFLIDFMYALP